MMGLAPLPPPQPRPGDRRRRRGFPSRLSVAMVWIGAALWLGFLVYDQRLEDRIQRDRMAMERQCVGVKR